MANDSLALLIYYHLIVILTSREDFRTEVLVAPVFSHSGIAQISLDSFS